MSALAAVDERSRFRCVRLRGVVRSDERDRGAVIGSVVAEAAGKRLGDWERKEDFALALEDGTVVRIDASWPSLYVAPTREQALDPKRPSESSLAEGFEDPAFGAEPVVLRGTSISVGEIIEVFGEVRRTAPLPSPGGPRSAAVECVTEVFAFIVAGGTNPSGEMEKVYARVFPPASRYVSRDAVAPPKSPMPTVFGVLGVVALAWSALGARIHTYPALALAALLLATSLHLAYARRDWPGFAAGRSPRDRSDDDASDLSRTTMVLVLAHAPWLAYVGAALGDSSMAAGSSAIVCWASVVGASFVAGRNLWSNTHKVNVARRLLTAPKARDKFPPGAWVGFEGTVVGPRVRVTSRLELTSRNSSDALAGHEDDGHVELQTLLEIEHGELRAEIDPADLLWSTCIVESRAKFPRETFVESVPPGSRALVAGRVGREEIDDQRRLVGALMFATGSGEEPRRVLMRLLAIRRVAVGAGFALAGCAMLVAIIQ